MSMIIRYECMMVQQVSAPRSEIEEMESMREQNHGAGAEDDFLFDMDEDENCPHDRGPLMSHSVAERLDTLMLVLLAYIKDMIHVDGVLDVERVKTLYRDLMCVFDKLVLPTHASCHVQFCMLYLCSFRLLKPSWITCGSPVLRQAAAAYMGSFLARAKFIPIAEGTAETAETPGCLELRPDASQLNSRKYRERSREPDRFSSKLDSLN
ncbi:hypothetical protein KOW79_001290 [Hemibagrus wyckioides]|uniref:Uncharacterized protein n=1 Tax=Hemibagrus wyckioides TaxID=337641 RepID=A0A9D3P6Z9_9TELE|nr:hypothetical protein KOW79_001290 [Hemibagrus wyckioides]